MCLSMTQAEGPARQQSCYAKRPKVVKSACSLKLSCQFCANMSAMMGCTNCSVQIEKPHQTVQAVLCKPTSCNEQFAASPSVLCKPKGYIRPHKPCSANPQAAAGTLQQHHQFWANPKATSERTSRFVQAYKLQRAVCSISWVPTYKLRWAAQAVFGKRASYSR